ncbi:HNH endonuclease signature motif containing protein [Microbacterium trichothecenolyticum]
MSNRRKPYTRADYRSTFLRSPAWLARRARWFRRQAYLRRPLVCAACGMPATSRELELHHLDYAGVRRVGDGWQAFERHDDLVPLHPYCHGLLHFYLERDEGLAYHRSRRVASAIALNIVRARMLRTTETS